MKKKIIMLGIILISTTSLLLVMFYMKTKDIKYISTNEINEYGITMLLETEEGQTNITEAPTEGYYKLQYTCDNNAEIRWSNISHKIKIKATTIPVKCTLAFTEVTEDFNIVAMYVNGSAVTGALPAGNYYLDTSTTKCYNGAGTEVSKTVTYDNDTRDIKVSNITEPVYCEVHLNSAYQVEIFTVNSLITDGLVLSNLILPLAESGTNNWTDFNYSSRVNSSYSDGVVAMTATTVFGGYTYNSPASDAFNPALSVSMLGDKIYSRATLKATSTDVYWIYANDGLAQGSATIRGNNTWETTSGIRTVSKVSPAGYGIYFKTQDGRTSGWDTYYLKEPMAISLTDTFGAGNEPDKAFMDRMPYLQDIDGYKNSYRAVGSNPTFNLTPTKRWNTTTRVSDSPTYSSVSCTNGQTANVSNNVLTISNLTNNTVCTIYYTF